MNVQARQCDARRIADFLDGRLSEPEQAVLEEHLSDCVACRASLGAQTANDELWDKASRYLRDEEEGLDSLPGSGDSAAECDQAYSIQQVLDSLAPTDDPAMLGRLGGYEISGVVGSGGMGIVLKALDKSLDRTVAIKVMAPHLATNGSARKRFAREAKAAAAVLHPNVMAIHSVSGGDSLPFLVMPYMRGTSLQKRLDADGPLPVGEILRIAAQTAAGLAAAHAQGLIHRDIKPANILLEEGVERVAITDFGLARAVDDATMTRTGVVAGTPQYMSPEQARGEPLDQSSDLFSLGSVLYAMCTGRPPFRAESSYGVLRRITDEEPKSIREINPDIPEWLCLLISRLMAKSPDARFGNALEVAALLEQCLAHVQQPTSVSLPGSLGSHVAGRCSIFNVTRKGVLAMLGTIGVTLLGMMLWQATEAPDIGGQWTSDEWGTVVLNSKHGRYEGTISNALFDLGGIADPHPQWNRGKCASCHEGSAGHVELKWSRAERRFNGTWKISENRRGKVSLRLLDDEIRGAWTTSKVAQKEPASPRLGDLLWTRSRNATSEVAKAHAADLDLMPVPQPVLSHLAIAEKTASITGMGGANQECVLRIAQSKKNKQLEWTSTVKGPFTATVTATDQLPSDNGKTTKGIVLKVQNGTITNTSNIGLSDGDVFPVGVVRFREASAVDRADRMMTFADIVCNDGTTIPISMLIRDTVDRSNARSVAVAYVAAALSGLNEQAAWLAEGTPAVRDQIESLPKRLHSQRLVIHSVYINDPAKPKTALAMSEAVTLPKKQHPKAIPVVVGLTLTISDEGWSVTDIDFESEESAEAELKQFLEAHPNAVGLPPLKANVLPGADGFSGISLKATDKQLGTVLGKPVHESDLNQNLSTDDNLERLFIRPLMENYCREHGLDRADELKTKIKDEKSRRMATFFVLRAELNRHLFEKLGGRVMLSAFGAIAIDGMRKWLDEREQAGDFKITDPQLKTKYREHWMQEPTGSRFASPDQIKAAFDPAVTDRFIENYAKIPAGAHHDPAFKLVGQVFGRPIYLHDRHFANEAELPVLLYTLVVPELEERYRKDHREVEPTDGEIVDLAARRKAQHIQAFHEQRKSLERLLAKEREANPAPKENSNTLAAIQAVDDILKRVQENDGLSQAAEMMRQLKFQEHIFDKHGGGRALTGNQGLMLLDAQKRWVEERERLGEFQIADVQLRQTFYDYWKNGPHHRGARLIEEDEVRANINYGLRGELPSDSRPNSRTTDSNKTTNTIDLSHTKANAASQKFPLEKVTGLVASIRKKTKVAAAVDGLRRITGLDFGDGVDRESRQAWLTWWEQEMSCIANAKDGVREFVVTGVVTANGKPVSGANVRAHFPFKPSPSGQYQLGETLSDSSGRYVLVLGIPLVATPEVSTWKLSFSVRHPPHFVADQLPVTMTLHRNTAEGAGSTLGEASHEKTNDAIYVGQPVELNFTLQPSHTRQVRISSPR